MKVHNLPHLKDKQRQSSTIREMCSLTLTTRVRSRISVLCMNECLKKPSIIDPVESSQLQHGDSGYDAILRGVSPPYVN